jgi:hypothetical protein
MCQAHLKPGTSLTVKTFFRQNITRFEHLKSANMLYINYKIY